ncbi:uncharacterized protein [Physcomitrium patens]|uniref:Golgin-84 n=1 Tax=Physcomitrium patens TaxID=3218 RepID=A0A2K1L0C5_PHYPA|nr:golgin candidate 2-like isoform X1 [Physcomitrium patens]PNR59480.1 hypothetical protein PHYPA_002271 [Physcomitrium patens]|eukprot:XP_024358939.1 golgin candidate 2-like isoform X1 [Physcomitrella patens]
MAGWLSSRLKAAEQLLQQIDQQAAITKEQLQNSDKDLTSFLSPEVLRVGRRANNDQQDANSSRPETLNLPSHAGNGKYRPSIRNQPPIGTRNSEDVPRPSKQDDFGKHDWTELLGSNDLSPALPASKSSSSVGSTDFGGSQSASRGGSQRAFHTAGKLFANSYQANESTPISDMSLGGAGPSKPSSVQTSRTKGPSKFVTEARASDVHRNANNHQEEDNVPWRLEYSAQFVEGTVENDPNELLKDTFSHTSKADIVVDPFVQPTYEDGEFTELELSMPEDAKNSKETILEESGRDNVVEIVPDSILISPRQSPVLVDEIKSGDHSTLINSDDVPPTDEKENHGVGIEAGNNIRQSGGDQEHPLDKRGNDEEIKVPIYVDQNVQDVDEASGESSGDSSLSGSEEQSRSGSGSESDSEYEERVRRRRERRKELAERRAAKAAAAEAARAAIRHREELVAQLEQEKEDLEKLLAEWEERQVKEAEELNLTMKEVSEAVEVERQRHAVTRREGLAREAQLEAKNQELAKALAAAERNLEDESARVALARSKVEAREIVQSDLQRKILLLEYRLSPPSQSQELHDTKIEREVAEEHYATLTARLEQYQNKAKQLEEKIFIARDAHYTPSVMELELETRLNQLTDHLIQKQSQVEALSTEKATLHFRLEAISNTLRMEKSATQSRASKRSKGANVATDWSSCDDDLEYGLSKPYSSKDKYSFMGTDPDMILNQPPGSHPWMHLARQVDSVFLGGARILRTSGSARALALLYIFLLHSWFLFILFMHTRSGGSGATSETSVQAGVNALDSLTLTLNSTALNQ